MFRKVPFTLKYTMCIYLGRGMVVRVVSTVVRADTRKHHFKTNFHDYFALISGTYQGQWMRGLRHGYGVRTSAPFGLASHYRGGHRDHRGSQSSLADADPSERRNNRIDDARGGFVLKASSDEPSGRRGSLVEKTKRGLLSVSQPEYAPSLSVRDLQNTITREYHAKTGNEIACEFTLY